MKYLLIITAALGLAACSNTSKQLAMENTGQYCSTSSATLLKDGNTSASEVLVECSDKPEYRAKMAGFDPVNCRPWQKQILINGRYKYTNGLLCKDGTGRYRPVY